MSGKETAESHYSRHSRDSYEQAWFYQSRSPYQYAVAEQTVARLKLDRPNPDQPSSNLVDIGCGTGNFTRLLRERGVSGRLVGVEPFLDFESTEDTYQIDNQNLDFIKCFPHEYLEEERRKGVVKVGEPPPVYHTWLFKEVVHHFPENSIEPGSFKDVFTLLHKYFSEKGQQACDATRYERLTASNLWPEDFRALIITRPHDPSHFPFFEKARQAWKKDQAPAEHIVAMLEECGFVASGCAKVSCEIHDFPVKMPFRQYKDMIRARFWSNFGDLTDVELEEGIREIELTFSHLFDDDLIEFPDKQVFISMTFFPAEAERKRYFAENGFPPTIGQIVVQDDMIKRYTDSYLRFRKRAATDDYRWSELRFKAHLFLPWLYNMIFNNENLVRTAKQLLNTDTIVCWSTDFCVKVASSAAFFSWHQDSTYSGWSGEDGATFWIAFLNVTPVAGPVLFKKTPRLEHRQLPHDENPSQDVNMLAFGQTISDSTLEDYKEDIPAILSPGAASVHDFYVVHSAQINKTSEDRVGLAIRLLNADKVYWQGKQEKTIKDRVTLLCGKTENVATQFDLELLKPREEFGEKELQQWKVAMDREKELYFANKETNEYR